jgi:hypothetical protein
MYTIGKVQTKVEKKYGIDEFWAFCETKQGIARGDVEAARIRKKGCSTKHAGAVIVERLLGVLKMRRYPAQAQRVTREEERVARVRSD